MQTIRKNSGFFINMNIISFGAAQCEALHHYGPGIRDHYLLVAVLDGEGTFSRNQSVCHLHKQEAFLVRPNELHFYEADALNPWKYVWVDFTVDVPGELEYFLNDTGIYQFKDTELFVSAVESLNRSLDKITYPARAMSYLNLIISELIESNNITTDKEAEIKSKYVLNVIKFIEGNYMHKITINELANFIGLNRQYLTRIFKSYTGKTPQNYIIDYKIEKACQFLLNTGLSVTYIANSVGYEDSLIFSKLFKKKTGQSPSLFREQKYKIPQI